MKLTAEKQIAFCAALAATCNVTKACAAVDIARQTAYEWKHEDPDFAERWAEALKIGAEALEDQAKVRAFDGVPEPVFHLGKQVSTVTKYSDTLTIFLLKGANPEKFRENSKLELSGHLALVDLSEDEIKAELALLAGHTLAKPSEPEDDNSDLV